MECTDAVNVSQLRASMFFGISYFSYSNHWVPEMMHAFVNDAFHSV